jgi:hypothetical protein
LVLDRTRWPELLVGLERVRVLEVARGDDGRVHVVVETTDELVACRGCGVRAEAKDWTWSRSRTYGTAARGGDI